MCFQGQILTADCQHRAKSHLVTDALLAVLAALEQRVPLQDGSTARMQGMAGLSLTQLAGCFCCSFAVDRPTEDNAVAETGVVWI